MFIPHEYYKTLHTGGFHGGISPPSIFEGIIPLDGRSRENWGFGDESPKGKIVL